MSPITLTKELLSDEGVVVLPLKEYHRLRQSASPACHLDEAEAEKVDALVKEGLAEYRSGASKGIKSLAELD